MAIISRAFPCVLLSAQHSVYPNVRWGGNCKAGSSINTLLSLTPSLIFTPFYHCRSFPRLLMGFAGPLLSGRNKRKYWRYIVFVLKAHCCYLTGGLIYANAWFGWSCAFFLNTYKFWLPSTLSAKAEFFLWCLQNSALCLWFSFIILLPLLSFCLCSFSSSLWQFQPKHSVNSTQMGFLQCKWKGFKSDGMYLKGVKCVTQLILPHT